MASQVACCRCGSVLAHKDNRSIVTRTVFGKVEVPSPRLWACSCAGKQGEPRRSVSPLCKAVPQRVTPELEYLQAKWAAHLPYRQATELLREVLPLGKRGLGGRRVGRQPFHGAVESGRYLSGAEIDSLPGMRIDTDTTEFT
jgi:hypothetical protein